MDRDRVMEIVKVLLKSQEHITINKIAEKINVSNKTIRNDLKKVQEILEENGLTLLKKAGVGISVNGLEENKINLLQTIKNRTNYIEPYYSDERKFTILRRLFMSKKKVVVNEISEELYVSNTTIHKDLEEVQKWLKNFNLFLIKKRNQGIEIEGEESNYRRAISELVFQIDNMERLQEADYINYEGRLDYKTKEQLKSIINIDYKKLEELISKIEIDMEFSFSQEAYISLLMHIAICIKRIKEGNDITLSQKIFDNIYTTKAFKCAKELSRELESHFNIRIPESETGYITLHILGSKMQEKDLEYFSLNKVDELKLEEQIARDIIELSGKSLGIDFSEDKAFLNGLILHLRPTINRLKYGLNLKNPMLEEIKSNYPEVFGVAWICSSIFEKYLDLKIPESEIGYIAIHIGAAAERNRKTIKTLVICHSGIGTSQLVSARLERSFKEIETIGIVSYVDIKKELLDKAEMIISTVPIDISKPVLLVTPLMTREDTKKIEKYIENNFNKAKTKEKKFIKKEIFYRSKKFNKREEIIHDMCKILSEKQYINKHFEQDAISRENMMSTEVGKGIAIPHGEIANVKESCIALTVLEYPMKWHTEYVQFIFMLCISEKDRGKMKGIIKKLYENMDDSNFFQALKSNKQNGVNILNKLEL
ncbi:transcription antiterminator [Clostridium sp. P21]|uniref:Transcription antiterminator n=1 Tax=Clostridium muellerianum TaxID=2716538 RepID=A0A7Y0EM03_9CLOT|nr:BglG family transcription antiterminator [Clostridium muellerianum]NMM65915.1 transcription antiterminator [Clostridium muellerianum]